MSRTQRSPRARNRKQRSWGELSGTERLWTVGQIIVQIVVRFVVLLAVISFATATDMTGGSFASGDLTGRTGTGMVRACQPTDALGIGFMHTCRVTLQWDDGVTENESFTTVGLGPADVSSRLPLREREGSGQYGSKLLIPELVFPREYRAFGWAVFVSVGLVALAYPYWVPMRSAQQRRARRRARRYRANPGLFVAGGYGAVFAGGVGLRADPPQPGLPSWTATAWPPWLLIIAGHAVLLFGLILAYYRRRAGYPQPPDRPMLPTRVARFCGAFALLLTGGTAAISALADFGAGASLAAWCVRLAVPAALVLAAARMLLVWSRSRKLPVKPRDSQKIGSEAEPELAREPSYGYRASGTDDEG